MMDWQLKAILKSQGITNSRQLHQNIVAATGISISQQSLSELIHGTPKQIRISTLQHLCDFLQVPASAFFEVTPDPIIRPKGLIIQPYKSAPVVHPHITNPADFL